MARKEISFWTEAENHTRIINHAAAAGLSLDDFINQALLKYIGRIAPKSGEQRVFPRKKSNLPIVLKFMGGPGETRSGAGYIKDISMGGVWIELMAEEPLSIENLRKCSSLEMLFLIQLCPVKWCNSV